MTKNRNIVFGNAAAIYKLKNFLNIALSLSLSLHGTTKIVPNLDFKASKSENILEKKDKKFLLKLERKDKLNFCKKKIYFVIM